MQCRRWMPEPLPLPAGPDAITADWMTQALASSTDGAEVAAVEVLDQHSGTTGRLRLGLTYAAGRAVRRRSSSSSRPSTSRSDAWSRPPTWAAGRPGSTRGRRPRPRCASLGRTSPRTARSRPSTSWCSRTSRRPGARFNTRLETHAEERGQPIIESLARLHAHFWNDPRFDDELSWVQPAMRGSYGAKLVANARAHVRRRLPAGVRRAVRASTRSTTRACASCGTTASRR